MEPDEELEGHISRRVVLKRIGVGAAIAWTAPIITSLGTPAFAQASHSPGTCDGCSTNSCFCPGITSTYSDPGGCGDPANSCFCSTDANLTCQCVFFPSEFCGDYQTCGPAPGYDCPSGFRCVTTCCCIPFCAPACPGTAGPRGGKVGVGKPPTW